MCEMVVLNEFWQLSYCVSCLSFSCAGAMEKKCFYSNGSDWFCMDGKIPFPNISDGDSDMVPPMGSTMQTPSWTPNTLFHVDKIHQNWTIHQGAVQVVSQTPVLKMSTTDERILTKPPGIGNGSSSPANAKDTLWSMDTSIKVIEKSSSVPMLNPTSPSTAQRMDSEKSKFVLMWL